MKLGSKEHRELQKKWDKRLELEGLQVIDHNSKHPFNSKVHPSIQEQIRHIHSTVGNYYMNTGDRVPRVHGMVLSRFIKGQDQLTIAARCGISRQTVHNIIQKYYKKGLLHEID
jgi:hypothetical protein